MNNNIGNNIENNNVNGLDQEVDAMKSEEDEIMVDENPNQNPNQNPKQKNKGEIYSAEEKEIFKSLRARKYSSPQTIVYYQNNKTFRILTDTLNELLPNLKQYLNNNKNVLDIKYSLKTYFEVIDWSTTGELDKLISPELIKEILLFAIQFEVVTLIRKIAYDTLFELIREDSSQIIRFLILADENINNKNEGINDICLYIKTLLFTSAVNNSIAIVQNNYEDSDGDKKFFIEENSIAINSLNSDTLALLFKACYKFQTNFNFSKAYGKFLIQLIKNDLIKKTRLASHQYLDLKSYSIIEDIFKNNPEEKLIPYQLSTKKILPNKITQENKFSDIEFFFNFKQEMLGKSLLCKEFSISNLLFRLVIIFEEDSISCFLLFSNWVEKTKDRNFFFPAVISMTARVGPEVASGSLFHTYVDDINEAVGFREMVKTPKEDMTITIGVKVEENVDATMMFYIFTNSYDDPNVYDNLHAMSERDLDTFMKRRITHLTSEEKDKEILNLHKAIRKEKEVKENEDGREDPEK